MSEDGASLSPRSSRLVVTRRGYEIDLGVSPITIPVTNGNRYISVDEFNRHFSSRIVAKILNYIGFTLERSSPEVSIAFVDGVNVLTSLCPRSLTSSFSDTLLRKFKAASDKLGNKHPARKVRAWLLWDSETSDAPILSVHQAGLVRRWRFKNETPYAAIRQGTEGVGPLPRRVDLKLRASVRRSGDEAAVYGQLSDHQVRTVIEMLRTLGMRPTQLCYTKGDDLKVWKHDGHEVGFLNIPAVKDGESPRAHFSKRRVPQQLLEMIQKAKLERAPEADGDWLFPRRTRLETLPNGSPSEEYWRMRSVDQTIAAWIRRRGLRDLDGTYLRANPLRLRYTFATELAPRMSPVELAHALGHKDQRSVMHYFTYGDDFFNRLASLDGATKWGLAAASFIGLISDERAETNDGGPILFSKEPHVGDTPIVGVGRCGAQTRCRLFPPLSCYGCSRFRPDPDADHAQVLKTLVRWRERRPATVGKLKDPLQGQLDEVIEAAGYLVGILPAYHWTRDRLRGGLERPTLACISSATAIALEILEKDRSISALLSSWPRQSRGAARIASRRNRNG